MRQSFPTPCGEALFYEKYFSRPLDNRPPARYNHTNLLMM